MIEEGRELLQTLVLSTCIPPWCLGKVRPSRK